MDEYCNKRYELIDKSLQSDKIPAVISNDLQVNMNLFLQLYDTAYDLREPYFKDVEVEFVPLCELTNYKEPPVFCYDAITKRDFSTITYTVTNKNIQHSLIDAIVMP